MARIAFLGLGQMGAPIASRLLQAGHELTVWNRTPGRAASLSRRGARVAASPAEAAAGADFVITMLATPDALEEVVHGADGVARALAPGQVLIDMSTVGPEAIGSIADRLPEGVAVVDAPVRGSVPEATEGRLQLFVGASDEVLARVRPILEPLGVVRHTGGPGSGASMKLVVNSTLAASMVALGEALALGESLALPRHLLLDVLADSPLGPTVRAKRANLESGYYPPTFKLRLAAKDMRLVTEAADATGRDLRVARATRAWLDYAAQRGAGDLDFSAVTEEIADAPD